MNEGGTLLPKIGYRTARNCVLRNPLVKACVGELIYRFNNPGICSRSTAVSDFALIGRLIAGRSSGSQTIRHRSCSAPDSARLVIDHPLV